MLFGTITIWVALLATLGSAAAYLAAGTQKEKLSRERLTRWGRGLFALAAAGVLAAAATLGTLLVTHRFDVAYVYQHSARAMAPLYWFPSFWAGQEGSFLLWAFWTAILGIVLSRTAGQAERRVMPIYSAVLLFLVSMLVIRSPFVPLDTQGMPPPTEGLGLNPNLENPWMVIHPPTLFLGFASLAAPFAFALSALFWRDWDGWLRRALPWALFGFAVLGLAMMMGGYWAYEMLGWGGFWGWDPVENGPFVPWLGLIGFLHLSHIQRVKGILQKPTLLFALLPFVMSLYETYLTRTGILKFSVHSFSTLGGVGNNVLLGVLLASVAVSVGVLLWRGKAIAALSRNGDNAAQESVLDAPGSREFAFVAAVTVLTLCALVAAIGMSASLLTAIGIKLHIATHVASVSEDFYNKATFPLGVLLAIGMGIGPHLAWRGRGAADGQRLLTAYALAVVGALLFMGAAHWLGTGLGRAQMVAQLTLFTAATFALISNIILLRRLFPTATAPRGTGILTVGGTLSHIGAAVLLLGIVCLVTFVRKDPKALLIKGTETPVLGGAYRMTYLGQSGDFQTDKNNALLFRVVSRDGRENFTARLPFALRPVEAGGKKMLFGHPAIVHHAGGDLYLALKDGPDQYYPNGRFVEQIGLGATKNLGPYTIQFVRFERDPQAAAMAQAGEMPERFPVWAVLRVTYHGQTSILKPQFIMRRDQPGAPDAPEIALPGGALIAFQNMNAGSADKANPNAGAMSEMGSFVLRPQGPVLEGFELEVTTRPMISLVWIGTLLLVAGGLITMRRRIMENRAMPVPDLPEPEAATVCAPRRAKGRVASTKPAPTLAAGRKGR